MSNSNGRSLSTQLEERGITNAEWHTAAFNLYPGASQASVLMVFDYCRARKLDPLKKPCHIVRMKVGKDYRDVVLPGIYEHRTTAQRTNEYMGHADPEFGPVKEHMGVNAPEWCKFTVYRWHQASKTRVAFPVTTYFAEVVATAWDKESRSYTVNSRWTKAPRQMLTKCAEAAALRAAFPDEIGGEMSAEEMDGYSEPTPAEPTQSINIDDIGAPPEPEDGAIIEGEVVEDGPSEPEPPENTDIKAVTFEGVKKMLTGARSKDDIELAMDLIRYVQDGNQKELRQLGVTLYGTQEFQS